jgi:hypothetical protein
MVGQVEGCGEYGDEPSCSADCRVFLDFASETVLYAVSYYTRSWHYAR